MHDKNNTEATHTTRTSRTHAARASNTPGDGGVLRKPSEKNEVSGFDRSALSRHDTQADEITPRRHYTACVPSDDHSADVNAESHRGASCGIRCLRELRQR